jgi:hypothetical protein
MITGNFYIGVHSTTKLDDGYLGSGKRLISSIEKHGEENHIREILEFFENREDAMKREREIVNEDLLKEEKCINLKKGGEGGLPNFTEEERKNFHTKGGRRVRQILSQRHIDRIKIDSEYREKWINSVCETKLKRTGSKNGWKGRKHSEEWKKMISENNKIAQAGEKNSQFGTCWMTNGKENKKIPKNFDIPEGWRLGRKIKKS